MTAIVVATGLAPLVVAVMAFGVVCAARRARFVATVRRAHPEIAGALEVDDGSSLGLVAARAVDIYVASPPRHPPIEWTYEGVP